jgi:hypothetical protein
MSGAKESGRQAYLCNSTVGWDYYGRLCDSPAEMLEELERKFPDLYSAFRNHCNNCRGDSRSDAVFFVEKNHIIVYGFNPCCLDEPGIVAKIKRNREFGFFNCIVRQGHIWVTKSSEKPRLLLPNGPLVIVVNGNSASDERTPAIDDYVRMIDCCGADFVCLGEQRKPAGPSDESDWLPELHDWNRH